MGGCERVLASTPKIKYRFAFQELTLFSTALLHPDAMHCNTFLQQSCIVTICNTLTTKSRFIFFKLTLFNPELRHYVTVTMQSKHQKGRSKLCVCAESQTFF